MLMGLETFFVKKPFSIWTQYALKLDLDCDTQISQMYIFSLFCHMRTKWQPSRPAKDKNYLPIKSHFQFFFSPLAYISVESSSHIHHFSSSTSELDKTALRN